MVEHDQQGNFDKVNTPDIADANAGTRIDHPKPIGIFTGVRAPSTQPGWREWLRRTEAVTGDLEKTARLMLSFQHGADYVEEEADRQGGLSETILR